jgi:ribulose-phosphate 3-epimerase
MLATIKNGKESCTKYGRCVMQLDDLYTRKQSRMLLDVSLWSGDLVNLEKSITETMNYADVYHLDVSDAHFVPGLLFFPDLIHAINMKTDIPLHTHLMMEDPIKHVDAFIESGSDFITVHLELGEKKVGEIIAYLKKKCIHVGLSICVESDIMLLEKYLDDLDLILLMGTKIGIKGVSMEKNTPDRVKGIKAMIQAHGLENKIILSVDGGIREHTVPLLREAGADMITPGSLVFNSKNLTDTVSWLHTLN